MGDLNRGEEQRIRIDSFYYYMNPFFFDYHIFDNNIKKK